MKIEIVVDPSKPAPAASLASRVAPAPAATEPAPRFAMRYSAQYLDPDLAYVLGLVAARDGAVVEDVARATTALPRL